MADDARETRIVPILPPRLADDPLPTLRARGQWEQASGVEFLETLAEALNVHHERSSAQPEISIPDPWGQVVVFTDSLLDANHSMHQCSCARWRGLLALLGLSRFHGLPVSLQNVTLSDLKKEPYAHNLQDIGTFSLAEVLDKVLPEKRLSNQHNWKEFGIIQYDGKPVGMLTPTTLVCPAQGTSLAFDERVGWLQDGELWDPCSISKITAAELVAIRSYVNSISQQIGRNSSSAQVCEFDSELLKAIKRQLNAYVTDLNTRLAAEGETGSNGGPHLTAATSFNLPRQPVYSLLARVPDDRERTSDESEALLSDTIVEGREELAGLMRFIAVDRQISADWGLPESSIKIWGGLSLEQVHRQPAQRMERMKRQMADAGFVALSAGRLFTDKLILLNDFELAGNPPDFPMHLLPLKPWALLLFSPDYLRDNLRLQEYGGEVQVSLRIPLVSSSGERRSYLAVKKYGKDRTIVCQTPPVSGVWPDFQSPHWKHYFMYTRIWQAKGAHIVANTPFPVGLACSGLKDMADARERFKKVRQPLADWFHVPPESSLILKGDNNILRARYHFSEPPEGAVCDVAGEKQQSGGQPQNLQGLMLLPPLPVAEERSGTWEIGVDLGTTNTTVYCGLVNGSPRVMEFGQRVVGSSRHISELFVREMERFFFQMDRSLPTPLMTLVNESTALQGADSLVANSLYPTVNIEGTLKELGEVPPRQDKIQFDLKWSDEPEDRRRIERFLIQIILRSLAEAVSQGALPKEVRWHFSYPSAFSREHLLDYKNRFRTALERVVPELRGQSDAEKKVTGPATLPESLCAALYFVNQSTGAFNQSALTLDIGGRTTDACIWQGKTLIWHSSFMIGAQDFLIHTIANNRAALLSLKSDHHNFLPVNELLKKIEPDPKLYLAGLEILVNHPRWKLFFSDEYSNISQTPAIKALRYITNMALCGMFHYLGMQFSHLIGQGRYEAERRPLNVFLGGRGSTIFKTVLPDTEFAARFLSGDSFQISEDLRVSFSSRLKHEVARGLLGAGAEGTSLKRDVCADTVWGEHVRTGNTLRDPGEVIKKGSLRGAWRVENLSVLAGFLRRYWDRLDEPPPISGVSLSDVEGRVNEFLEQEHDRLGLGPSKSRPRTAPGSTNIDKLPSAGDAEEEESLVLVQPAFIIALREYVRRAAEQGKTE